MAYICPSRSQSQAHRDAHLQLEKKKGGGGGMWPKKAHTTLDTYPVSPP